MNFSWLTSVFVISQLRRPSLSLGNTPLYWAAPPQLEETTRPNLVKKLGDLLTDADDITVTDSALPITLSLRVTLT